MAEVRERKCRDYNIYMLRAMFTTDESAHECSRSIPAAPKLHFRIPAEDKSSNVPIRVKVEVNFQEITAYEQLPLASPTRATCRGGFGAFTAFRRLRLRPDRQDSRNLHYPSLSSP